jgi:hypothetical protein
MHFLDDKAGMTLLLHEKPFEFVILAKLLFDGGEGYLSPVPLAKAMRTSQPFITDAMRRLEAAKKIEVISRIKHHYRIADFAGSSYGAATKPEYAPDSDAHAALDELAPSEEAFRILETYHDLIKPGGPFQAAAERIQTLLVSGVAAEDIITAIRGYASTKPESYARNACNFFEPIGGGDTTRYWGQQWAKLAPKPKLELVKDTPESDLAELLRRKVS